MSADLTVTNPQDQVPGPAETQMGRNALVGASYATWRLDNKTVLALSLTSPFGLGTKAENQDWDGNYEGVTTSLINLNAAPSVSYEVAPASTSPRACRSIISTCSGKRPAVSWVRPTCGPGAPLRLLLQPRVLREQRPLQPCRSVVSHASAARHRRREHGHHLSRLQGRMGWGPGGSRSIEIVQLRSLTNYLRALQRKTAVLGAEPARQLRCSSMVSIKCLFDLSTMH